jgi:hypothetical protein
MSIESFLESQARQFSPGLQESFEVRFKGDERAQHFKDVEDRLKEEISDEAELALALSAWRGLSDYHFRISYAIFWNARV